MRILLILMVSIVSQLSLRADSDKSISNDYEVIQIFTLNGKPTEIGLVRKSDSKRIYTTTGKKIDGIEIIGTTTLGSEQFVTARAAGVDLLFALKRPDSMPFWEGPLLTSYKKKDIDEAGKLTPQGHKAIVNNLRQYAAAGSQYILENGTETASHKNLKGEYFKELRTIAGESYETLDVLMRGGTLSIVTLFGETVTYQY